MDAARLRTPHVLLTRHFLRRFLENDLISPDADRLQLLVMVSTTMVSLTLCVTVLLSFNYLMNPLLTPGLAAVLSLNDKFFYLALGMIVTALVAASQWDALAVDPRDAAILEPLPVPRAAIRRAKLTAVAALGVAAALLINVCPSLVFPSVLVYGFRELSLLSMLGLIAVHALATVAASGFGYLTVIALREAMVAVLGDRWFSRVSPWAQGTLIVLLGGSLLLLPAAASRVGERGFDGWRAMAPPMWFLGAYEITVGGVIADLPRGNMRGRQADTDRLASARYRERQPQFPALARRAGVAILVTLAIAATAYLWNARRVSPLSIPPAPARRRPWRSLRRTVNATLVRRSAARAGFYFALAAMWRSSTHRLTLASAAAVGLAMAVVAVTSSTLQPDGSPPPRLLSMQPLLYGALLVGFRHAIRVPAELRANWGFQLAWRGQQRAFLGGAKRAALVALAAPAVLLLLPLFVVALGVERALLHALLGLGGALVLLEALTVHYEKAPFTCTYVPSETMKALAPLYVLAFVGGASLFARMQHDALYAANTIATLVTLALLFAALRLVSVRRVRGSLVQFDEAPASLQRLGLDG